MRVSKQGCGYVAGPSTTRPASRAKQDPCHGQRTVPSSSVPADKGPPRYEQVSPTAYTCPWGRASRMGCPPPPPGASALRRARALPAGCERPRAGGPRGVIDPEAFAIHELPAERGGTTGNRKTQERRPLPRNAMLPLPLPQRGGRQGGSHGLHYTMQEAQPSGSMLRVWPIGDPRDGGTNRPDQPDFDRRIGAPATRMAS
jgi:hypothetical protein